MSKEYYDENGLTAIHRAARDGDVQYIKAYLGDVNVKSGPGSDFKPADETTPLILAVMNGQLEAVEALIKGGADVNKAQKDGMNPLDLAIFNTNSAKKETGDAGKIIDLLIANGAKPSNFPGHNEDELLSKKLDQISIERAIAAQKGESKQAAV